MLKAAVRVVEAAAVVATIAFVVLLFANEPSEPAVPGDSGGGGQSQATQGAGVLFAQRCAGCHGREGGGASAPRLAGGAVVDRFPDRAEQIAVVRDGRGRMPAFGGRLTDAEIEAVVTYTREQLP